MGSCISVTTAGLRAKQPIIKRSVFIICLSGCAVQTCFFFVVVVCFVNEMIK